MDGYVKGAVFVLFGYAYMVNSDGKLDRYEIEVCDSADEMEYMIKQWNQKISGDIKNGKDN